MIPNAKIDACEKAPPAKASISPSAPDFAAERLIFVDLNLAKQYVYRNGKREQVTGS
jgi:hypothetical protein